MRTRYSFDVTLVQRTPSHRVWTSLLLLITGIVQFARHEVAYVCCSCVAVPSFNHEANLDSNSIVLPPVNSTCCESKHTAFLEARIQKQLAIRVSHTCEEIWNRPSRSFCGTHASSVRAAVGRGQCWHRTDGRGADAGRVQGRVEEGGRS